MNAGLQPSSRTVIIDTFYSGEPVLTKGTIVNVLSVAEVMSLGGSDRRFAARMKNEHGQGALFIRWNGMVRYINDKYISEKVSHASLGVPKTSGVRSAAPPSWAILK